MKDTDSKIKKISALFWGSLFRKPHLAAYYLDDWSAELTDRSSDKEKGQYEEARFWHLYVQGNPIHISSWVSGLDKMAMAQLPIELIDLYGALHTAKEPNGSVNLEVRAKTLLPLHLLEHVLLAEIYMLARRHKAAWKVLQNALQRHQAEYQSDKNQFLLGVIYDLLAREALAHDDFFQCDNWLSKMRSIIKSKDICALEKRWQWSRLKVSVKKKNLDSIIKIWNIEDAKNWPAFTDEFIAASLGTYYFQTSDSARLQKLAKELENEFETSIALHYLNWLRQSLESTTKLPQEWSSEKIALLLSFLEEIQNDLNPKIKGEIAEWRLRVVYARLEMSADVEFKNENDEFPNRSFFYYLISLYVAALENLRQFEHTDTATEEELLHRMRVLQMLQMCFHETLVPPIYIFDVLCEMCSWNPNINLAAIKGEWRSKAPVPVALFFQVFLVCLASLKAAQYSTDLGVSFSSAGRKISLDWHFRAIEKNESESLNLAFHSLLKSDYDELNDALYFIEQHFPGSTHELDLHYTEEGQAAWQLDLQADL